MAQPSPTDLYRRATTHALAVAEGVRPDQLDLPTPCSAWTVQDLLDHLLGGTHYLGAAHRVILEQHRCNAVRGELRTGRSN